MTELPPAQDVDLRRGFRRAGSTLFWLSAGIVMMLWAAQKAGLLVLGSWNGVIAFAILFVGFSASGAARMIGLALDTIAKSSLATEGAARVSTTFARLGWLPRLIVGFLPGANLLTVADLIASIRDGSFAQTVRSTFQMIGAVLGGGLLGIACAAGGWRWSNGAALAELQVWMVVAGVGMGILASFLLASGWVAQGFKPAPKSPQS
jgi:hypothetical protein